MSWVLLLDPNTWFIRNEMFGPIDFEIRRLNCMKMTVDSKLCGLPYRYELHFCLIPLGFNCKKNILFCCTVCLEVDLSVPVVNGSRDSPNLNQITVMTSLLYTYSYFVNM